LTDCVYIYSRESKSPGGYATRRLEREQNNTLAEGQGEGRDGGEREKEKGGKPNERDERRGMSGGNSRGMIFESPGTETSAQIKKKKREREEKQRKGRQK